MELWSIVEEPRLTEPTDDKLWKLVDFVDRELKNVRNNVNEIRYEVKEISKSFAEQVKELKEELAVAQATAALPDVGLQLSTVPPLGSGSAVPAARQAYKLLRKAAREFKKKGIDDAKLIAAMEKLDLPITNAACAEAYDCAREVRKDSPLSLEELAKNTALVVREVLVLQICTSFGSLSDVSFECALEHAFGRELGPQLRSQMHLARSAICRIGRDRVLFERQAPKIYGPEITTEELSELFLAYADCAAYTSLSRKASREPKTRKPKTRQNWHTDGNNSATDAEMEVAEQEHDSQWTKVKAMVRDFITVPVKQDEDPSPAASEPHWIFLAPSEPQYVCIDGVSTLPTQSTDSTHSK